MPRRLSPNLLGMTRDQIDLTVRTFTIFTEMRKDRLQRGLKRRDQIHKAGENGGFVDGFRAEWASEAADAVLEFLEDIADDFNHTHLDDQASRLDLGDILSTAISRLAGGDESGGEEEGEEEGVIKTPTSP